MTTTWSRSSEQTLIKLSRAFENDLVMILMNIVPSVTARKGCSGRAVVSQAFEEYFRNKGHEQGSALVQSRYNNSMENKIPLADIARYEVGGAIAILVNTTPAVFWVLYYVFAHPNVLEDTRKEVSTIMTTNTNERGVVLRSLDISSIKSKCPLLTSTFQEVLRHTSMGVSVRQVMKDVLLEDRYLLKKDSTVLMPSLVLHTDPSIWGPDVRNFNHKRFMKDQPHNRSAGPQKRPNPAAFRAFGGGTTLCPGRHFATTEILAVVVMCMMRYELMPVNGRWIRPTTEKLNIAASIMGPDNDIEVDVFQRKGYEGGEWAFSLADSEMVFAVAAEDRTD